MCTLRVNVVPYLYFGLTTLAPVIDTLDYNSAKWLSRPIPTLLFYAEVYGPQHNIIELEKVYVSMLLNVYYCDRVVHELVHSPVLHRAQW